MPARDIKWETSAVASVSPCPWGLYVALAQAQLWPVAAVHAGLWVLGVLGVFLGARQLRQRLGEQLRAEKVCAPAKTAIVRLWKSRPILSGFTTKGNLSM